MEHKKEVVKEETDKNVAETCVCNMEWRGTHGDEWGDCVCYPEEEQKAKN